MSAIFPSKLKPTILFADLAVHRDKGLGDAVYQTGQRFSPPTRRSEKRKGWSGQNQLVFYCFEPHTCIIEEFCRLTMYLLLLLSLDPNTAQSPQTFHIESTKAHQRVHEHFRKLHQHSAGNPQTLHRVHKHSTKSTNTPQRVYEHSVDLREDVIRPVKTRPKSCKPSARKPSFCPASVLVL